MTEVIRAEGQRMVAAQTAYTTTRIQWRRASGARRRELAAQCRELKATADKAEADYNRLRWGR